jgi:hypothetical protein
MKSTHILLSLAILSASIFGFKALWHTSGSLNQGLSIYAFILFLLGLATAASPIVILLIALRKLNPRDNRGVSFLFIINSFWGFLLIFEILTGELPNSVPLAIFLASLNLLWAFLLLILTTRKRTGEANHSAT